VATALAAVARAHPAVALRLQPGDDGPALVSAGGAPSIPLDVLEGVLDGVDGSDRALDDLARDLVAGLDPEHRPLTALLVSSDDGAARLLLAASRVLFDETSLTVLTEDFSTAWRRIAEGAAPDLAPEGRGFAAWARSLDDHGESLATEPELASWLDVARTHAALLPTLPTLATEDGGDAAPGGVAIHRAELDEAVSAAVVATAPEAFRAEPGEVVLAALVGAVSEVSGTSDGVLVRLEQDGRAEAAGEHDRAVGCFTVAAPLLVAPPEGSSAEALLTAAKGARRGLARAGLGHGLVLAGRAGDRAAAERLEAMPRPQVGLVGTAPPAGSDRGWGRSAPSTAVELRLGRRGERLTLDWIYDPAQLSAATVTELARATAAGLERLAEAARTTDGAAFDPTDFPEADLSSDDLDSIFSQLEGDS
jgi:hypothetical protein